MEKSVREDEAPFLLTNTRSFDACEDNNGVSSGNGVLVKRKRRGSENRSEVVGQLKRRKNSKEAFSSSLEPALVKEQWRCSSSAASKLEELDDDAGQSQGLNGLPTDPHAVNDSNDITHGSGEKWVVKKKDESRQVTSNLEVSSHLGSGLKAPRCTRDGPLHKKQNGSSLLRKGEVAGRSNSSRKDSACASDSMQSGEPAIASCVKQKRKVKELAKSGGKKRILEEQIHHQDEKDVDARSTAQRKHQRSWKKSKNLKKEINMNYESNGHSEVVHEDDEENLEQNAARMLSSRFDPRCTSKSGSRKTLTNSAHLNRGTPHVDDEGEVPRTGKQNGDHTVKRRRHFYEIFSKDVDPYWVLTRRIKVFWPLDKSWYFGLVKDYNPSTGLHNVKYDDHDEEWINLQTERFKLLLFPTEFKCKFIAENDHLAVKHEQDAECGSNGNCGGNIMESEPIISWLARSIRRVKTSQLNIMKEKKRCHSTKGSLPDADAISAKSRRLREQAVVKRGDEEPISENNPYSLERKFYFYYSRRRFHQTRKGPQNESAKCHDGPTSSQTFSRVPDLGFLLECVKPGCLIQVLSSEVWKILNFAHIAGNYCVYNFIWCYAYDTLVVLWPRIHMEILILDNDTGIRFVSFVGCLMHAISLMRLTMSMFDMSGYCANPVELKLPVTSIGFKLSRAQQQGGNLLFSMQFFQPHNQSKWIYLEKKLRHQSVLMTKFPLSACTYTNISNFAAKSYLMSLAPVFKEGARKGPLADVIHLEVPRKLRKSAMNILCRANHDDSRISFSFSKESTFPLNWHLKLLMKSQATCVTKRFDNIARQDCQENDRKFRDGFSLAADSVLPENATSDNSDAGSQCSLNTTNIRHRQITRDSELSDREGRAQLVTSQLVEVNVSPSVYTSSTCSRSTINDNEQTLISPSVAQFSLLSEDFLREGSCNSYRKPRTQVSYSIPHEKVGMGSKNQNYCQSEHPCKRIRTENTKRIETAPGSPKQSVSSLTCEANILITEGDRGRRHLGAQVLLHYDDHDWKILVKLAGIVQYSYKAHQFMQPGITNRYNHAMMWKGGKDWTLEFTQRSQWVIFREMHEECYNRNMRAANIKNIPIPGVRLIEDSDTCDTEVPFVRSSLYFRQIGTEVDMAMDPCHMIYDMDSDDEVWVSNLEHAYTRDGRELTEGFEDIFERAIDMMEKVSYSQKRDEFSDVEIESFLSGNGPLDFIRSIYGHWQRKRQKKGMPLVRQFQPPLWEWYQKQLKEWETAMNKISNSVNGTHEKGSFIEKPPMFAFCLKPRGMDISNKGPKQRSHKKMTVAVNQSLYVREQDNVLAFGRKSNGFLVGSDRTSDSSTHYHSPTGFSPRSFTNMGFFGRDSPKSSAFANAKFRRIPHLKISRSNSMRIGTLLSSDREVQVTPTSYNHKVRRSSSCRWNAESHGWFANNQDSLRRQNADIDEFRLRDASSAAQHALNMAKLKREKAQWLLHKADLAIHKAVVALTTAEAMRASERDLIGNN